LLGEDDEDDGEAVDGGGLAGRFGAGLAGRGGGAPDGDAPPLFFNFFLCISSNIGFPVDTNPPLDGGPPLAPPPDDPPLTIDFGERGLFICEGSTFFNRCPFLIADMRSSRPEAFECSLRSLMVGMPDGGGGGGGGIVVQSVC